jgi:uncharacterized protein
VREHLRNGGNAGIPHDVLYVAIELSNTDPTAGIAIAKDLLSNSNVTPMHLEYTNSYKKSALFYACFYGNAQIASALVEAGADVNTTDRWGFTPLMKATINRHETTVEMLLEHGAGATSAPIWSSTALMTLANSDSVSDSQDVRLAKMLLERGGVDVNAVDCENWSALMFCTFNGHHALAKFLLKDGKANANIYS